MLGEAKTQPKQSLPYRRWQLSAVSAQKRKRDAVVDQRVIKYDGSTQ